MLLDKRLRTLTCAAGYNKATPDILAVTAYTGLPTNGHNDISIGRVLPNRQLFHLPYELIHGLQTVLGLYM